MGACESKDEVSKFADIDENTSVYDTKLITFDENGHLIYGLAQADKNDELAQMMNIESRFGCKKQETWYIVDAVWLNLWLLYVRDPWGIQPRPMPCFNHRLVYYDEEAKTFKSKPKLKLEVGNIDHRSGDYRRVNVETWKLIQELYPGSGPTITSTLQVEKSSDPDDDTNDVEGGKYDTSDWVIETSVAFSGLDKEGNPLQKSLFYLLDMDHVEKKLAEAEEARLKEEEEEKKLEEKEEDAAERVIKNSLASLHGNTEEDFGEAKGTETEDITEDITGDATTSKEEVPYILTGSEESKTDDEVPDKNEEEDDESALLAQKSSILDDSKRQSESHDVMRSTIQEDEEDEDEEDDELEVTTKVVEKTHDLTAQAAPSLAEEITEEAEMNSKNKTEYSRKGADWYEQREINSDEEDLL